ncbi:MAG: hypothetical protein ABIK72_07285 [candidate division WOR-3 bacterium]
MNYFLGETTSDSTAETNRKISMINSAKNYLLSNFTLPNSIKTQTISFVSENFKYPLNSDFLEEISLQYRVEAGEEMAKAQRDKDILLVSPSEILNYVASPPSDALLWATNPAEKIVYLVGQNTFAQLLIDGCESLDGWISDDDATNLRLDNTIFQKGGSSIKFDIDTSLSPNNRATLIKNFSSPQNWNLYKQNGVFSFYVWLGTTTNFSSISFKIYSSTGNYYSMTTNTQSDGSSFQANTWNSVSFKWEDATIVGSPNASAINKMEINLDYTSAFVPLGSWRIDQIILSLPDQIDLKYITNLVIQDSSGTLKSDFTATTDIALYLGNDPLLLDLNALLAGVYYRPLMLEDRSSLSEFFKFLMGKAEERYPKRISLHYGRLKPPIIR